MALVRDNYKVPLKNFNGFFAPELDMENSKYWICLDMFYDNTVDPDAWPNGRPCVVFMPGGGVTERVNTNNVVVQAVCAKGWVCAVVLYHHPSNTDPLATPQPPWFHYNTPATYGRNQYTLQLREIYNLDMCFRYIVDNLMTTYNIAKIKGKSFFFLGKSMGGAACIGWSVYSSLPSFKPDTYGDYVGLIANNCGIKGQSVSKGWYDADKVLHILCGAVTLGNHPMVHVYNDGDISGDYDIYERLRFAIPTHKLYRNYFANFPDLGHTAEVTFSISAMQNVWDMTETIFPGKPLNCKYNKQGVGIVNIIIKSELQLLGETPRGTATVPVILDEIENPGNDGNPTNPGETVTPDDPGSEGSDW